MKLLKITRRYQGLNVGGSLFLDKLIGILYKNVLNKVLKHATSEVDEVILMREGLVKYIAPRKKIFSYEGLYINYIGKIEPKELSNSVNRLVQYSSTNFEHGDILRYIRIFIFGPYFGKWCPLVEFARSINSEDKKELIYIGDKNDADFQVLSIASADIQCNIKLLTSFSDWLLNLLSELKLQIAKSRSYSYNGAGSSPKCKEYNKSSFNKTIVITIQEERRFLRILKICEELEKNGYGVILFAFEITSATLLELNKYPDLLKRVIFSCDLVDKHEVVDIQKKTASKLRMLNSYLRKSDELSDVKYREVPLHKYVWGELEQIILLRGVQSEICKVAIERLLEKQKIDAFIGLDNGFNTCAWMRACEVYSIPSFLHFYNAVLTPAMYQMMLDSFKPTAWLLGGSRQFKKFKELNGEGNFYITGDIFADEIAKADRINLGKNIKKKLGISYHSRVIVLMSSYVTDDFTYERKRTLFTSVDAAVGKLGLSLIIRPHPNENVQVLNKQIEDWKINCSVINNETLLNTLFASDLVCMYYSEVAQQAMSVGVPVLSLVPDALSFDFDKHWGYYSSGAVKQWSLGEDPTVGISELLDNKELRHSLINKGFEYVEINSGERDGNNAKRFVDVVKLYC